MYAFLTYSIAASPPLGLQIPSAIPSTINKSTDYFNTKLYTGNGGTNAQTGVGFQPDFLLSKRRSGADNGMAFDSVRGVTKRLLHNLADAEATDSNILKSSVTLIIYDSSGSAVKTIIGAGA